MSLPRITTDDASSFAHSIDESVGSAPEFYRRTAQWLTEENPVLASVTYSMARELARGDDTIANICLSVTGYALRLLAHAEENEALCQLWRDGACDPERCLREGSGERKFCCKRRPSCV